MPPGHQGVVEFDERLLGFELPGRVATVPAREGATVAAGAILATLDDQLAHLARTARRQEQAVAEAQLALLRAGTRAEELRAAEAQLAAARAVETQLARDLSRQQGLTASGARPPAAAEELATQAERATQERTALEARLRALRAGARQPEIASAEARVLAARTAAELEEARIDRHRLRAPTGGLVLEVNTGPGEVVAPGSPVLVLADVAHPYVDVFVPLGQLRRLRPGAPARVLTDTLEQALAGRVEHIGRHAEFTPRYLFSASERPALMYRVRVRIDAGGQFVHAGAPAFVSFPATGAPGPTTSGGGA